MMCPRPHFAAACKTCASARLAMQAASPPSAPHARSDRRRSKASASPRTPATCRIGQPSSSGLNVHFGIALSLQMSGKLAKVQRPQSDGAKAKVEPWAGGFPADFSAINVKYATTRSAPPSCAPPKCRMLPSKSTSAPALQARGKRSSGLVQVLLNWVPGSTVSGPIEAEVSCKIICTITVVDASKSPLPTSRCTGCATAPARETIAASSTTVAWRPSSGARMGRRAAAALTMACSRGPSAPWPSALAAATSDKSKCRLQAAEWMYTSADSGVDDARFKIRSRRAWDEPQSRTSGKRRTPNDLNTSSARCASEGDTVMSSSVT
mmetsp:Transcript_31204/g.90089  ORF Transcript_31204/g.90089 Transcript_31204/m.90089 type:complete len:323 (+) Transcript_31204:699-1667(+)